MEGIGMEGTGMEEKSIFVYMSDAPLFNCYLDI